MADQAASQRQRHGNELFTDELLHSWDLDPGLRPVAGGFENQDPSYGNFAMRQHMLTYREAGRTLYSWTSSPPPASTASMTTTCSTQFDTTGEHS